MVANNPASTPRSEQPLPGPNPGRLAALRRLMRPARPMLLGSGQGSHGAALADVAPAEAGGAAPGPTALVEAGLDRAQRALAERLTRGVLRHLSLIDAVLMRAQLVDMRKTPPANLWVLRLAIFEKLFQGNTPDYAVGAEAVALARAQGGARAAGFVNAVVRRLLPKLPASYVALTIEPWYAELPLAVRLSIPAPLIALYEEGYGAGVALGVLEALAAREGTTWLRANRLRGTAGQAAQRLSAAGVELTLPSLSTDPAEQLVGRLLPEALLWSGGDGIAPWHTDPWHAGALTVQDLGSMAAAPLLQAQPGMRVLDLCAAPGGKAGHLWEMMQGHGELVAVELEPRRREVLRQALARLYPGADGLHVADPAEITPASESYDRVLVDAPCLGLGLLGRHPEVRWDYRERQLGKIQMTQRTLLSRAAAMTCPGGHLLWMTCSPTVEENEQIVNPWLAQQGDAWRKLGLAEADPRWAEFFHERDGFLRTLPDRQQCDAFCLCLLERRA